MGGNIIKTEFYEISDFIFDLQMSKRLSDSTINSYLTDLQQYALFLKKYQKITDVSEITRIHIDKYLTSLRNKDLSSQTITRKVIVIKKFHKFLSSEKIVDKNIGLSVKIPTIEKRHPDFLTIDEINTLINSIDTSDDIGIRNKAMFELMYACGLKVSELLDLKISNVHLIDKFLTIESNNKTRSIPIGDEAVLALRVYIEKARSNISNIPGELLFYNYQGNKMSRQGFHKFIVKLGKDCNIIKEISSQTLRHSLATHLIDGGVDILIVQKILGHMDISTTQMYTQIDEAKLKESYLKNHPLARKENYNEEI